MTRRLLAVLTSLALLVVLASACADPCRNTVLDHRTSPDGRLSIVLFARDCGATTGYSTHVSVLDVGAEPRRAGNVFVADLAQGGTAAPWGGPWAQVDWLIGTDTPWPVAGGPVILYDEPGSRVFKRQETRSGVQISYEVRTYRP